MSLNVWVIAIVWFPICKWLIYIYFSCFSKKSSLKSNQSLKLDLLSNIFCKITDDDVTESVIFSSCKLFLHLVKSLRGKDERCAWATRGKLLEKPPVAKNNFVAIWDWLLSDHPSHFQPTLSIDTSFHENVYWN